MAYITLTPQRATTTSNTAGDKVTIGFPTVIGKKHNELKRMHLYMGQYIAKKFGFNKGDRLVINIDEYSPNVWVIEKREDGWKLIESGKRLSIQIPWDDSILKGWGKKYKYVHVALVDGKMQITLPLGKDENTL